MFELLKEVLTGQNQFASGGLLLMIIGGIRTYRFLLTTDH